MALFFFYSVRLDKQAYAASRIKKDPAEGGDIFSLFSRRLRDCNLALFASLFYRL